MACPTLLSMTEPQQAWNKISRSPLARLYLHEVYMLAVYMKTTCESLFETAPARKEDSLESYVQVGRDIHTDLANLLTAAARVRALVIDRPKGKRQTHYRYSLQKARVAWLRQQLDGVPLEAILDAGVRNSLEHFDEYLDEMAGDLAEGVAAPPALVAIDVTLGHRGLLDYLNDALGGTPRQMFVRVYHATEREYINFGRIVNIQALYEEACALRDHLIENMPILQEEEGSGTLLAVRDDSFFE